MKIFYKPEEAGSDSEDELAVAPIIMDIGADRDGDDVSNIDVSSAEDSDENFVVDSDDSLEESSGSDMEKEDDVKPEDLDEEDEVIKKIIEETKKQRNHPPDIKTEDFVVDISFNPAIDMLAVGLITGDVLLYKYSNEENTIVKTLELHTKACRDVEFNEDGNMLFSASKDKGIMITDIETGKLVRFYDDAHESSIFCLKVINENLFATGDDDGHLKVWDLRQNDSKELFSLHEVDDYISSILAHDSKKLLLMTSGDGYLTTINLGSRKMYVQSEQYQEELLAMGLFKNDTKLVVGTSKGKLYTFNWGQFGYHCDSFAAPKSSINAMIPVTQRMAVLGGEDGILRAMNTIPGKNMGIVGQHSLAVETMDISNSGEFIASSSHDNDIRFWNIKYFEDFEDVKFHEKSNLKEGRRNLPSSKYSNASDFFSGLAN